MTESSPKQVLLVEDEMIVAMLIEDMLMELGHTVAGSARSLPAAMALADAKAGQFDVAILDINLGGEQSFPVARLLKDRGAPFIFATGYGQLGLEDLFRGVVTLNKPFRMEELAQALARATPS